jgi:predicted PurR-regulated permease PerM
VLSDQSLPPHPGAETAPVSRFVGRMVVAVAIVAVAVLIVVLRDVIVLVFGSIVVAAAVLSGSELLQRRTGLSARLALAAVVLGTVALIAAFIAMLGDPVGEQFDELRRALPGALAEVTRWLNSHSVGIALLEWWEGAKSGLEWSRIAGLFGSAVGALGSALLMLITGLYLAADPALYRRGLLHLLPRAVRPRVDQALRDAGHGLSRWLVAQGIAMLAVGVLTAIGLALIGQPLAIPLGIIAGLLEFVPFVGTFASSALIVLLAFAQGAPHALYAALICFAVQQFEGYVVQPFVQRWAIALPPALGLIAVVAFGVLFGPPGVVFAVPLMVVVLILVQRLYVDAALEGEPLPAGAARGAGPDVCRTSRLSETS